MFSILSNNDRIQSIHRRRRRWQQKFNSKCNIKPFNSGLLFSHSIFVMIIILMMMMMISMVIINAAPPANNNNNDDNNNLNSKLSIQFNHNFDDDDDLQTMMMVKNMTTNYHSHRRKRFISSDVGAMVSFFPFIFFLVCFIFKFF